MDALKIMKAPEGGFIVITDDLRHGPGYATHAIFACSDIAELLDFIEEKLEGKPGER